MTRKMILLKPKEHWKQFFIEEYIRLHNPIGDEYNRKREENTPSWVTIAKMFGLKRWSDWLNFCGLEAKRGQSHCLKVQIRSHFLDEIERLWSKEKIKEFFPGLTCDVVPSEREDVPEVEEVLENIRQIRREFAVK